MNFRLACPSDDRAILGLLCACYPHLTFSTAWWKWFSYQRHDARNQTYLAENQAEIIGCLSFMPVRVCSVSGVLPAAVCANIAVHPGFRRNAGNPPPGVFAQLLDFSLRDRRHKAETIHLVVPNAYSQNTFLRSGWQIVSPLRVFEKRKLANNSIGSSSSNWEEVHSFDEGYDRLNAEVCQKLSVAVWKSSEYLRWRITARPHTDYHIFAIKRHTEWLGCVVLKRFFDESKGERKVHVMQMLARNDEVTDQLLQGVEAFAAQDDLVNLWVVDGDGFEPALLRRGFREKGSRPLIGIADQPDRSQTVLKGSSFSFADIDVY